jgi:hypothetical protein
VTRKLALDDIADLRAYERERNQFRAAIIDLKKRRRVSVGPFVTFVFENRDTIRFQIQEMARVERLITDDAIQGELDIYNPLIPDSGTLAATMFIELTSKPELEEWLPKLVGIERTVEFRVGAERVRATPDAAHEAQLTRETITPSVHYVHFGFTDSQVGRFGDEPVVLALTHENYAYATELPQPTVTELLTDLH